MPELPEVETTVRGIKKYTKGKIIARVWTDYNSKFHAGKENIKNPKYFARFKKEIVGSKITGASRRAKNVLIHLSNEKTIVVHMKMTGHIMYGNYNKKDPFNRFIRFIVRFSDGKELVLSDMRKFAKVHLIDNKELLQDGNFDSDYGPEPLENGFTFSKFQKRLKIRPHWKIKQSLLDQGLIAGIGNIYSDEILWRASIHPESEFQKIPLQNQKIMFKAMKEVLKKGIDFGGDSMSDYRNIKGEKGKFQEHHMAYRRTGKECPKRACKGHIIRKKVAGRSAHFCDAHQKLFK